MNPTISRSTQPKQGHICSKRHTEEKKKKQNTRKKMDMQYFHYGGITLQRKVKLQQQTILRTF